MLRSTPCPPISPIDAVTEVLHGVTITDPYRWLEDNASPRTRNWIEAQNSYARRYLDAIPGRDLIGERIRQLLDVECHDSLQRVGSRYFFRKRLPGQEQPMIFMRDGATGTDQLLVDPKSRGTGDYTAVKPLIASPDGRLLLYEVKQGGERAGTFELLDVENRMRLPDCLPRGFLRGFAFAPDGRSFFYSHESVDEEPSPRRAAYQHFLGTPADDDREVFFAGEGNRIRLVLSSDSARLLLTVYRYEGRTLCDIYLLSFFGKEEPQPIFERIDYVLDIRLAGNRLIASTDRDAPNRCIIEIRLRPNGQHEWICVVPEADVPIHNWILLGDRILISYLGMKRTVATFTLSGQKVDELLVGEAETVRMLGCSPQGDEVLLEEESFTEPARIFRYSLRNRTKTHWSRRRVSFESRDYDSSLIRYTAGDGTEVPMYLVGRRDLLHATNNPTIMTAYGGYGVSVTPKFSVFMAFLLERGCLFALPAIRGGGEFGTEWHRAAKRRNRQCAFDDFLSAADWLIANGISSPLRIAIFGGSNGGLLVGAALTQRPELFRAVLCMVPMLDMLRFHLFDNAHVWTDEFGTAEDPEDFTALARYSPYHRVRDGTAYPATMIVSGDADGNCNPLHARKMTARLQAASASDRPVVLDYSKFRGHSPVLPLSQRVDALTDRLAFICDQLQLPLG